MIYIEVTYNNVVSYRHNKPFDSVYGLNKTEEELLKSGFLIDSAPEPEQIEGKVPILKYDGSNLYYEYNDAQTDEMTTLKNELENQKQALAELMMYVATLTSTV